MGVVWLGLLASLVALNGWLASSAFGPLRDLPEPDFVLVLRPAWHLGAWWLGSVIVLVAAHAAVAKQTFDAQGPTSAFAWRCVRLWASLLLLALPPLAMAMLATPLRMVAPPWLYLFVDLRGWLIGGVAALVVLGFDAAAGRPIAARVLAWFRATSMRPRVVHGLEFSLVGLLAVASLATSPTLRFQSAVLGGDEPKYLRYLENWYRGRGSDIVGLVPISELPAGHRSDVLGNLHQINQALFWAAADLADDARRLAGLDARPRPGPAKSEGGWFVEGKRGGVYQVHSPGFSLLLFPGYFLDRALLNWTSSALSPQLPTDLYCTNGSVLILYLLWGAAVFRLLWAYTGRALMSALVACVVMLSLPCTAFAYQYYPEVAAGLGTALIVPYVLLSSDARPGKAAAYGLLAGYLPWLHVRFGLLTILAGLCFTVTRRRAWRAVLWFWIGVALPLAVMGVYHYHITGNPMPWALYALTREAQPFGGAWHAAYNLPSFWFDWGGGLLAHAPIYVLAVPGLWLCWRRNPHVAISLALFVLALAVPAAGHGWSGAGTTPLRLVAAVVPLVALPVADAALRYGGSRWFLAIAIVLGVISVQNGFTYNTYLDKSQPWLLGPTISGWLSPLLLPHFDVSNRMAHPFIWMWIVATVALAAGPALRRRTPSAVLPVARRSWLTVTATVVIAFAALASLVGASLGYTFRSRFMMEQGEVRARLLLAHQINGGGLGWSARRGPIEMNTLFPHVAGTNLDLSVEPTDAIVQSPIRLTVTLAEPGGTPGWGTARVDFGDGSPVTRLPVVGDAQTTHRYATAGEYTPIVDVTLADSALRRRTGLVRVRRPDSTAFDLDESRAGSKPSPMRAPVTIQIESVMVHDSQLVLRCRSTRELASAGLWVWLLNEDGEGVRRARLHDVSPSAVGESGTFELSLVPGSQPADSALVGVVVGARRTGSRRVTGRSDLVSFRWPAAILTKGSGVVVGPSDRVP